MPANFAPVLYQGDDYVLPISIANDDLLETPVDITGWSFVGAIKLNLQSPTTLLNFTLDVTDASAGELVMSLTAAQTLTMPYNCVYDLQATKPNSSVETLIYGFITVLRQV